MLEDKVVLITGAAEGMGESHARVCAGYGAIVVLADLDRKVKP
jgi:3alpha(or 20beta)-hydroxysteroid dehydrogenase